MPIVTRDIRQAVGHLLFPDDPEGANKATRLPRLGDPTIVPIGKPLSELTIGLLVSLGANTPDQEPLRPTNDLSYRLIPRSVPSEDIRFGHRTPARFWADEDLNVAFPRDRMAELEAEGLFRALAPDAVSILGSITRWDELATETAPAILAEFARQKADLVFVVPFCPQCHQAVAVVARVMETRGMPTLMMSTLRDVSEAYRPPRTALVDYPVGSPCGRVGDPYHQRATLRAALGMPLDATRSQIHHVDIPYQEDGKEDWIERLLNAYRENIAGAQANLREHAHYDGDGKRTFQTLVGQEDEFTIRCNC